MKTYIKISHVHIHMYNNECPRLQNDTNIKRVDHLKVQMVMTSRQRLAHHTDAVGTWWGLETTQLASKY